MKYSIGILLIHFFSLTPVWSQSQQNLYLAVKDDPYKVVSTEFADKMNHIFAPLDKRRVPEGMLFDFAMEFAFLPAYNGTLTESNYVDMSILRSIYYTLLMSRVRDDATTQRGFVQPEIADQRWQRYYKDKEIYVALSGMYFEYSRFAKDAYTAGKITYDKRKNQLHDKYINSVWQNPYQTEKLFALAPLTNYYQGLTLTVKIPQILLYTNHNENVQHIQADFSDGKGYRRLNYGTAITIRYQKAGIKTWKFKLILKSDKTLFTHSKIEIYPPKKVLTPKPTPMPKPSFETPMPKPTSSKPTLTPTPKPTSSKPTLTPMPKPTSSKPTTSTPKPTSSKPILTPMPKPTSSKPTLTPTPKPTSSKPTTSTPKPTSSKPILTPTPKPTSSKPTTSTPKPKSTSSKPTTSTPKPKSTSTSNSWGGTKKKQFNLPKQTSSIHD